MSETMKFWAGAALLFGQTVISSVLFGRNHQDGGAWPLILILFCIVNSLYIAYMAWLINRWHKSSNIVFFSTALLSLILLAANNVWIWQHYGIGENIIMNDFVSSVLSSPIYPYIIYFAAAALATVTKSATVSRK